MDSKSDNCNKKNNSEEDACTTRFLESLLQYDYEWRLDCEKACKLTLSQKHQKQFLNECSEFFQELDGETEAAMKLKNIRELYNKQLQNASQYEDGSTSAWFFLADKLFRKADTSSATKSMWPLKRKTGSRSSLPDLHHLKQMESSQDVTPDIQLFLTQDDSSRSDHKKMEVESVMVTGANKGIGLEFVKEMAKLPKPPRLIFATYRDESTTRALKEIRDESKDTEVVLVKMDITKANEIADARKIIESKVGDKGLNLLINNAGVLKWQGFPEITEENMLCQFSTNAVGPVMVLKEILPLLQKSAARKDCGMNISRASVLNISSTAGSISELTPEVPKEFLAAMGYRISKAALNMAMRVAALTLYGQGILVVNMCPGWVKTDMGTDRAHLTLSESISAMLKTLPQLNESHHGTFIDRNGKPISY